MNLNGVMMDFDANTFYRSAMWDEITVYLKKETTGFAFKLHMNDVYVEAFKNQPFNQGGKESAKF